MFKGSFVALATPMLDSGEVDYESLGTLVEFHINNGTDGIVSVGTTGESATLPFSEHIKVIERTVDLVDGKLPIIAGSGANSTEEAVFLTKQIAKAGVDGFLSVVPYYNKPQQKGLLAHFDAVASASDLPLILYNVPARTVLDMHDETVIELSEHSNIIGLKDATGDLNRLQSVKANVDSSFMVYSGDDATACEFMCMGGDGIISVSANIVPKQMASMCRYALNGEYENAKAEDSGLQPLHELLFIEPNPVMPKWALYKMELIKSPFLRLPLVLPELNSQTDIERELVKLGIIRN
ncbi:4-hydroxy-tetrahydrodipicolinate synthase [Glaciecola petra]|uniref:4-hydroxy-tetrahydrodipicolinate synthase n=1 Tax=Glaciecola petra TaxID=3075602 RepID=A0ABU2ZPL6_9ALTE|nr:4-hydroxy-tetrahydrodipicolinate synthase [Aestuariibacter sp. P117]MDT0594294.1 4-hydroxy-tetrahydrodipicolinate synthase [Aestuariibacter sp. P117]